jgi:sugar (pentulose or hexulose) kinase
MQRALSEIDRAAEAVVAVIATTTRDCITLVDRKGKALAPTVTWVDFRSTDRAHEMSDELGPRGSVKKIMWFAENKPHQLPTLWGDVNRPRERKIRTHRS